MESPSSTTRATRSHTISKKIVECEGNTNPRTGMTQKDQRALVDITNDSPIVGLAKTKFLEEITPSSELSKKRVTKKIKIGTPGSGEALLRAQVRTLLEKVEEEAEFSKICHENRVLVHLQGFINSPLEILAPANTPQIPNLSSTQIMEFADVTPSLVEDELMISEIGNEIIEEKKSGEKDLVTRSLLFDFIEKFDGCDSSDERIDKVCSDNDDDVSVWSLEVNVSSSTKDELEDDDDADEEDGYEDVLNEVCEGLSKIKIVKEEEKTGKHTRFLYDSDEETALHLNGLPKPEGKHIRFDEEDDCSDEE